MIVVADHVRGTRRGTRQQFESLQRLTIGRHADSDVRFDGGRDIDASTRHAELTVLPEFEAVELRDLGSSNGTWVGGEKVESIRILVGESLEVEFGRGGPMIRFWLGAKGTSLPLQRGRAPWWRRFLRR